MAIATAVSIGMKLDEAVAISGVELHEWMPGQLGALQVVPKAGVPYLDWLMVALKGHPEARIELDPDASMEAWVEQLKDAYGKLS